MKLSPGFATIAATLAFGGASAIGEFGQCGGFGWFGITKCESPYVCTTINPYHQCVRPPPPPPAHKTTTKKTSSTKKATSTTSTKKTPSTSAKPTSSKSPATSSTKVLSSSSGVSSSTTSSSAAGTSSAAARQLFQYFGVNESGAEFGNQNIPGVLGTDYTWPTTSSVDYFLGLGFNTFRVTFLMERLSPPATGLTGPFDPTYLSGLKTIASYITANGGYALIDPHNYLRYNGSIISDNAAFSTWWTNLSQEFIDDDHIVFDLNNEPHDIPAAQVYETMQAAVNAIRAGGATKQLIVVEGTSWTGAWTWASGSGNGDVFGALTDPADNIAIEMHQYLDSDGSGTSTVCVNNTIGVDRLTAATEWLLANNKKALLGEIGTGSNDDCIAALQGAFTYMQQPGSPWLGALWWAAGPWWGSYYQSIEPPDGPAIAEILPQALEPFLPVA